MVGFGRLIAAPTVGGGSRFRAADSRPYGLRRQHCRWKLGGQGRPPLRLAAVAAFLRR